MSPGNKWPSGPLFLWLLLMCLGMPRYKTLFHSHGDRTRLSAFFPAQFKIFCENRAEREVASVAAITRIDRLHPAIYATGMAVSG